MVILENIDIDMYFPENIDIDKEILTNIDINIDIYKEILKSIDIDKAILQNIDIDRILYRFEFGISNSTKQRSHIRLNLLAFLNAEKCRYCAVRPAKVWEELKKPTFPSLLPD